MDITLKVPRDEAAALTARLREVENVEIFEKPEARRAPFERRIESAGLVLTALVVACVGKVAPVVFQALRDVLVEYLRSQRSIVIVRTAEGEEVLVRGDVDEGELRSTLDTLLPRALPPASSADEPAP